MDSFEEIRKLRNAITHTVSKREITAKQIITNILLASETFTGPQKWLTHRRKYLERDHTTVIASGDYNDHMIACDMLTAIEVLGKGDLKRHFGFDKTRRRYQCFSCYFSSNMGELDNEFAVLEPNTSDSTNLYCFVCNSNQLVIRHRCENEKCKGNVIHADDRTCFSCGLQQG